jgi:dihydrofolate reductase
MGMAKVIIGISMSLDGFINDAKGSPDLLYTDFEAMQNSKMMQESIANVGAVIMGRHMFDLGGDDWGDYEFQAPIFVLTHHPPATPPKGSDKITFTFVTDGVESAVRQAKAAAGEKNVEIIGSASLMQQVLMAGLADELTIDVMAVLLGEGLRAFDHLGSAPIRLERLGVEEATAERTHLRFRIVK